MFKVKILILSASIMMLAGCTEVIIKEKEDSPITQAIAKSADVIHQDLLQLTKLKELSPHPFHPRRTPITGPLSKKMTLKWFGRPEEAVRTISTLIGFLPPKITGKPPANAQLVMINAMDKSAAEILEDIGIQMGSDAGIAIGSDRISIIYEGAHE